MKNMLIGFALMFLMIICAPSLAQQNVPLPQINPIKTPGSNLPIKKDSAERIYQSACPALLNGVISAQPLPPIVEGQCGERSPLRVSAILGRGKIKLSSAPQLNCRVATSLAQWSGKLNDAAQAAFGASVETIFTGNGYQCRRRNNLPEGKISEHGFANAIDILGFKLRNGTDIIIERDWGDASTNLELNGFFLRTLHKQACEIFTTVLGPQTNAHHKDHFHFDLGCHGKKCTYKVCE